MKQGCCTALFPVTANDRPEELNIFILHYSFCHLLQVGQLETRQVIPDLRFHRDKNIICAVVDSGEASTIDGLHPSFGVVISVMAGVCK